MPPATRVEIFQTNEAHAFAAWQNVFLVVWRTGASVAAVRRYAALLDAFAPKHPDGVSVLVAVEESCELPDSASRELLAADMKRRESFTRYMALVYEGSGFRSAAIRGVVTTLSLVSRSKVKTKVFAQVADAAAWMLEGAPRGTRAEEIVRAMADARAAAPTP